MSAADLTAAEKRLLVEGDGGACEPPCEQCLSLFEAVEFIVAEREKAAHRRALEDAADDLEGNATVPPMFWEWLRARAAAVGPRETKD